MTLEWWLYDGDDLSLTFYKVHCMICYLVISGNSRQGMKSAGKSLSEALILAATDPKYVKRLFIELLFQYMKTTSSEHVVYTNCFCFVFVLTWHSEQFMYRTCSELVVFMCWTHNSMTNLSSYCGLVDGRIRTSEKDLPVTEFFALLFSKEYDKVESSNGYTKTQFIAFQKCLI